MRFCIECNDKNLCDECIIQYNKKKDFEAILNELKRQAPIDFGPMLPYVKE